MILLGCLPLKRKFSSTFLFTEDSICELHKRMYGNVWDWAGEIRKTNKNIGVDKWQIPTDLMIKFARST